MKQSLDFATTEVRASCLQTGTPHPWAAADGAWDVRKPAHPPQDQLVRYVANPCAW